MARFHEYQGKAILAANGFKIPRGVPHQMPMKLSPQRRNWAAKL